jgi:spore germination protein GerM
VAYNAFPSPLAVLSLCKYSSGVAGSDTSEQLTKDKLQTAEAVLSLGLIVVRELYDKGIATVFINTEGQVEICPNGEVELDGLTQEDALSVLLDRGYDDVQLLAYIKGRKAREATQHG